MQTQETIPNLPVPVSTASSQQMETEIETSTDSVIFISPREAVIFWVRKVADKIAADGLPGGLGMIGTIAGPILQMAARKVQNISDAEALEIINAVHSLSAKLEDQTGLDSPFH